MNEILFRFVFGCDRDNRFFVFISDFSWKFLKKIVNMDVDGTFIKLPKRFHLQQFSTHFQVLNVVFYFCCFIRIKDTKSRIEIFRNDSWKISFQPDIITYDFEKSYKNARVFPYPNANFLGVHFITLKNI